MWRSQLFLHKFQWLWIATITVLICYSEKSDAFSPSQTTRTFRNSFLLAKKQRQGQDNDYSSSDKNDPRYQALSVIIARRKLEERHTRDFLTSKPRHFSYKMCRDWVHAQNYGGHRWKNKREWDEWIDMGEGKSFYIPSRPEEYYTNCVTWVSWDDFLGIE